MTKTLRQLREERGESVADLARALGIPVPEPRDLEDGIARPSVERLRLLARHFGVDETGLDLEPYRPPSVGEQIVDAITG